jgi:hypothetical protein
MNPDFVDLLRAFTAADVRYLVVGAYALALHGRPRATGDLDIWVDAPPDKCTTRPAGTRRVRRAHAGHLAGRLRTPRHHVQIGLPPVRIDILTELTDLTFAEAWPERMRRPFGSIDVDFIGRDAFVRNKRATGRPKDLVDIQGLE